MARRGGTSEQAITALIFGSGGAVMGLVGLASGAAVAGGLFLVASAILVATGLLIRSRDG